MQLINGLRESTVSELLHGSHEPLKMLLVEISTELTTEVAWQAPKLFQLRQSLGEKDLLKLICFIIKAFADSIKVKDKLTAPEIVETAHLVAGQYSHDSVKDIMLAFKRAKLRGRKFYQSLDTTTIFEVLNDYFDEKARFVEEAHRRFKDAEANNVTGWMGQMPDFVKAKYLNLIPENHPNRQTLRLKITIEKKRRGIK